MPIRRAEGLTADIASKSLQPAHIVNTRTSPLRNLDPADLKKDANGFDLPIALGLPLGRGQVAFDRPGNFALVAELALSGEPRPVKGIHSIALQVAAGGRDGILVPRPMTRSCASRARSPTWKAPRRSSPSTSPGRWDTAPWTGASGCRMAVGEDHPLRGGRRNTMATGQMTKDDRTSEIAILARLIKANSGDLSVELARYILTLGFDEQDQNRMRELAERNQEGALTSDEQVELQSYVKAGHLLALLHSKARRSLKAKGGPWGAHE
jgi:hypothetical protein